MFRRLRNENLRNFPVYMSQTSKVLETFEVFSKLFAG